MTGIIGKKVGMTNFFSEDGKSITCTVIEAGPCYVTEIRNNENNGYEAVQIGFDEKSEKNTTKPLKGHFQKAGVNPLRKLVEFKDWEGEYKLGEEIKVDIFKEGDIVEVKGKTKGKGFQGVVKRHGFAGVGGRTHGQHNRERASGSIGAASFPSRVFKGMKMAGRQGNDNVKVFNLEILKVMPEENLLFVKGSIPGHKGSYVIIEK